MFSQVPRHTYTRIYIYIIDVQRYYFVDTLLFLKHIYLLAHALHWGTPEVSSLPMQRSLWSQHLATSDRQVRGFSWWFNGDLMGISWKYHGIYYIYMIYDVHYNQQSDSFNPYFSFGMCLELGPRGLVFLFWFDLSLTQLGQSHLDPSSCPIWACPEVVSDFDTFTVGSKNMVYESLLSEQVGRGDWLEHGRCHCTREQTWAPCSYTLSKISELDFPEEVFPIFLWVSGIFEKAMEGEREREA